MENWLAIPEYEGLYEVSDAGRVRRIARTTTNGGKPQILRGDRTSLGYSRVQLFKNGVYGRFQVHRLVMLAFVGHSELSVNHINGEPSDNRLYNLEYLTMADNLKDSWKRSPREGLNQGARHGRHKLCDEEVKAIRERRQRGEPIAELANAFNVTIGSISMIANGKTWRHLH